MATLVDSNILVSFLIESEKTDEAEKILEVIDEPATTLNVLEEVIYVGFSLIYGCRGFALREEVKRGLSDNAITFLNGLKSFVEEFEIDILQPPSDLKLLLDIITSYCLLPNDALIAATCKHYGIKRIATFDEDFERVDFLEVFRAGV